MSHFQRGKGRGRGRRKVGNRQARLFKNIKFSRYLRPAQNLSPGCLARHMIGAVVSGRLAASDLEPKVRFFSGHRVAIRLIETGVRSWEVNDFACRRRTGYTYLSQGRRCGWRAGWCQNGQKLLSFQIRSFSSASMPARNARCSFSQLASH